MTHTKLVLSAGLAFSLFGLAVACSETADPAESSSSSGEATSSGGSSGEETSSSGGKNSSSGGGSSSGKTSSSGGSSGTGSSGSNPDFAVVINELATDDDFVELFNPTDEDVDLSGYVLTDLDSATDGPKAGDDRLVLEAGTVVEAGGYLTIAANADVASPTPVPCFAEDEDGPGNCPAATFNLSKDEADAVFLLDADENEVLRVDTPASPDPDAGAAALADTESWGRSPNGDGDFEILTTRTPGRSND